MKPIDISNDNIHIRSLSIEDYAGVKSLCEKVYPFSAPWKQEQLASHLDVFPDGQIVAIDKNNDKLVGYAASLVVNWEDYELEDPWKDFTDGGYFTNHDIEHGRTLYGAEIMVCPEERGKGIGKLLYRARQQIVEDLELLRIRAGARLRGYATYSKEMKVEEYIWQVLNLKIFDPTLSFQIKRGFKVLNLIPDYLKNDPESLGYAVLIEWLNPARASQERFDRQNHYYQKLQKIYQT